jgi:hypothetical protein
VSALAGAREEKGAVLHLGDPVAAQPMTEVWIIGSTLSAFPSASFLVCPSAKANQSLSSTLTLTRKTGR